MFLMLPHVLYWEFTIIPISPLGSNPVEMLFSQRKELTAIWCGWEDSKTQVIDSGTCGVEEDMRSKGSGTIYHLVVLVIVSTHSRRLRVHSKKMLDVSAEGCDDCPSPLPVLFSGQDWNRRFSKQEHKFLLQLQNDMILR